MTYRARCVARREQMEARRYERAAGRYFGQWGRRRVAETWIGDLRVSTIFLGLDHNSLGRGPPILFETMVFAGHLDDEIYCRRHATWKEATLGHAEAVEWAKRRLHTWPDVHTLSRVNR